MVAVSNIARPRGRQVRLVGATANTTVVIPKGYALTGIYYKERAGNAITGGVRIGTTDTGTEVVVAQAVTASQIGHVTQANILLRFFSTTVDTTLYVQAVTAWNSATLDVWFCLDKLVP